MAATTEGLLKEQFAKSRLGLRARQDVGGKRLQEDLDRRQAIGGTTGASDKIRRKALTELETSFGAEEANLGAQEAAALAGVKEAELGRTQQAQQFADTLAFQKTSFGEQMKFQWAEFDENLKTNFINSAIALKDAGLQSSNDWSKLLGSGTGFLDMFSGDMAPNISGSYNPIPGQGGNSAFNNPNFTFR